MASARERVQSLDARLRELEQRFMGTGLQTAAALPEAGGGRNTRQSEASRPALPAPVPGEPQRLTRAGQAPLAQAQAPSACTSTGCSTYTTAPGGAPERRPDAPRPAVAPHRSGSHEAVPLRLYRQGLPHRDLGPPQSVWEADKNAAVVALSDRVQQLEEQLQQAQQQQSQTPQPQGADEPAALQHVMPPPPLDVLPVPRTILGSTSHPNVAAYDGLHAHGAVPVPVKFYPPPPPGEPMPAEAAVMRVQAAQGARGQARAFAASVTASAAATVPSVMMRKKRDENAVPQPHGGEDLSDSNAAREGAAQGCGAGGGGGSSIGVSAPLGYARPAASAAASVHMAALREAGPLQPAGPYPMVAAALAVGTPGTGGSTWEQSKMRALMSLEQQRDALRAQVKAYEDQADRHRREMVELNERHRQDLSRALPVASWTDC